MNNLTKEMRTDGSISIFKDPFNKKSIEGIFIHIRKKLFDLEGFYVGASISFKNGDTHGEQKIEASTFDECVKKVQLFIDSLEHS